MRVSPGRLSIAGGFLLALAAAAPALGHGGASAGDLAEEWPSRWSLPPLQVGLILVAALLYGWRARRLGARLPRWRRVSFAAGLLTLVLALCSPIDPVGEDGLFAVHMLQHALLGSLAPLLIVLGLTGPMLRPVLRLRWVRSLRGLAHPLVALPLWVANLVIWHVPSIYEFGVVNGAAHALQHGTTFTVAALLWAPVAEPLPAPEWFGSGPKLVYLAAIWVIGLGFTNVFWFSGTVFYDRYEATAGAFGVSALQDQANAGSVFMAEHMIVVLVAMALLAMRLSREGALRQRLLEAGVDARSVRQAVRYGRAEALARRAGLSTGTRAGID